MKPTRSSFTGRTFGHSKFAELWLVPLVVLTAIGSLFMADNDSVQADTSLRNKAVASAIPIGTPVCPPTVIEGFDAIMTLPGAGWHQQNLSSPIGTTAWFQGNPIVFPAHTGEPDSYIGANFNNAAGAGTISNWLITPVVTLQDGAQLSFYTRTVTVGKFPDRLQVRMSTAGASTNVGTTATDVGDFTTLLLEINPTQVLGVYPNVWTQFTGTVTGVSGPMQGRLALRYFVTDAGPIGVHSDYIGIDTVTYSGGCPTAEISGSVLYSIVTNPVPEVTMTGAGSPEVSTTTGGDGMYQLSGFGAGAYTVTPSKPGQQCGTFNGIFSVDAAKVSQYVVGLRTFNANEQQAAMVAGLGFISSFDAALIARRVVGLCTEPTNLGGQWVFTPANRIYPSVTSTIEGENYTAILMGDVDGDWNPLGPRRPAAPAADDQDAIRASLPTVVSRAGEAVEVPLTLSKLDGTGITAYQFDVEYDPEVIEPAEIAADLAGTHSANLSVVHNVAKAGLLKVAVYGAFPASGDGTYINLRFRAIGKAGSTTPLAIRNLVLNDGTAAPAVVDGLLTIADSVRPSIFGRVSSLNRMRSDNNELVLTGTSLKTQRKVTTSLFRSYNF